jgi:hypothetical protein
MSSFPVANGGSTPPVYPSGGSGNTLQATGFIPEIWSGKLVEKFYASTVLAAISNTDYEGEIKNFGDHVKIRTKPTITINPYAADGALSLQRPSGNVLDLYINQGYYFNTILDDVMEVQSDLNLLSMWSDDAAEQMKIQIDQEVLTYVYGQADASNKGTSAGKISSGINLGAHGSALTLVNTGATGGQVNILDLILRMGQCLDEQNIPETGRWVIMPAWAAAMLKASDLRQAYLTGDAVSVLRNGRLGMIDRFTLYISNLLPIAGTSIANSSGTNETVDLTGSENIFYAGHAHGLTFASQVSKVETMRSEQTFGTILRGLQVYGRQVLDGKALVQAVVTNGGY